MNTKTILSAALFSILAIGCSRAPESTLNDADASSRSTEATYVEGYATVRVIGQHNYVSLELKGDELGAALYQFLKVDAVTEGDDGDYYTTKTSDELRCGGANQSPDGDMDYFDEIYCVINYDRAGEAGVTNNDPYAWANATFRSEDIPVLVKFAGGKAKVYLEASADSHVLYEELTDMAESDDEDAEISTKTSKDIELMYEYADGDDFSAKFVIDSKGMLSVR